jgi:hypothetical protein
MNGIHDHEIKEDEYDLRHFAWLAAAVTFLFGVEAKIYHPCLL